MRVAVVNAEGVVENVVVLDEDSDWQPDEGFTTMTLTDDQPVGPGYKKNDSDWDPPAAVELPPVVGLSMEERLSAIEADVKGMRERAAAASVTNVDAVKVRDAIAGPPN